MKYAWGKVSAIKTQEDIMKEIIQVQKMIDGYFKQKNLEPYEMNNLSLKL